MANISKYFNNQVINKLTNEEITLLVYLFKKCDFELKKNYIDISRKEYCKLFNIKERYFEGHILDLNDSLWKKGIDIDFDNGNWCRCKWISSFYIDKDKENAGFEINRGIQSYLVQLFSEYLEELIKE